MRAFANFVPHLVHGVLDPVAAAKYGRICDTRQDEGQPEVVLRNRGGVIRTLTAA